MAAWDLSTGQVRVVKGPVTVKLDRVKGPDGKVQAERKVVLDESSAGFSPDGDWRIYFKPEACCVYEGSHSPNSTGFTFPVKWGSDNKETCQIVAQKGDSKVLLAELGPPAQDNSLTMYFVNDHTVLLVLKEFIYVKEQGKEIPPAFKRVQGRPRSQRDVSEVWEKATVQRIDLDTGERLSLDVDPLALESVYLSPQKSRLLAQRIRSTSVNDKLQIKLVTSCDISFIDTRSLKIISEEKNRADARFTLGLSAWWDEDSIANVRKWTEDGVEREGMEITNLATGKVERIPINKEEENQ